MIALPHRAPLLCLLLTIGLIFGSSHQAGAQPLAINPSAASSEEKSRAESFAVWATASTRGNPGTIRSRTSV